MIFPEANPNEKAVSQAAQVTEASVGRVSFAFDFDKGDFVLADGKVKTCEDTDVLRLWVHKTLITGRGRFRVYDGTGYGADIEDLVIGNRYTRAFVQSELRREIEQALKKHPRVKSVADFEETYTGDDRLVVSFRVITDADVFTEEATLGYGG